MGHEFTELPRPDSYQVTIRPYVDIRNPDPGLVKALAGQFEHALFLAEGCMCVTVPHCTSGDGTPGAVETVLRAAAAHHEADGGSPVHVEITNAMYTADGYCHVLSICRTTAQAPAV